MGFDIRGCPMSFKNKNILFWNQFSYMENECVRESARTRDMGAWHVDMHVEMCMFYLNVCGCVNMALHVHLGGE